jgi:hypothetical protein
VPTIVLHHFVADHHDSYCRQQKQQQQGRGRPRKRRRQKAKKHIMIRRPAVIFESSASCHRRAIPSSRCSRSCRRRASAQTATFPKTQSRTRTSTACHTPRKRPNELADTGGITGGGTHSISTAGKRRRTLPWWSLRRPLRRRKSRWDDACRCLFYPTAFKGYPLPYLDRYIPLAIHQHRWTATSSCGWTDY